MTGQPTYSVCIPNFNYAHLIDATIRSALAQGEHTAEVLVADNASTDASVSVVQSVSDPRVRLHRGAFNVGFAGNLDKTAQMARSEFMLMLSSDDLMEPTALATYGQLHKALGRMAPASVVSSTCHVIDAAGNKTGRVSIDRKLWLDAVVDPALSDRLGAQIWSVPAAALLRRSLMLLRNPFPFLSTCYSRTLYERVGGYAGRGIINPDKWFAYKLLSVAERAYFIDTPLFSYRVHAGNQTAQQTQSGALKHLMDQYTLTFDLADDVLKAAGVDRRALADVFIEQDVCLRGLVCVAKGQRGLARRMAKFGDATFPSLMRNNSKGWLLKLTSHAGPLGTLALSLVQGRARAAWQQSQETDRDVLALDPAQELRHAA